MDRELERLILKEDLKTALEKLEMAVALVRAALLDKKDWRKDARQFVSYDYYMWRLNGNGA